MTGSRRSRGFSLVEVVVVSVAIAIGAAVAIAALSTALEGTRRESRLRGFYDDMARRRAAHLGMSTAPDACLRVEAIGPRTLSFVERGKCDDPTSAGAPDEVNYDVTSLTLAPSSELCIDNLARARVCGDFTLRDHTFTIDADKKVGPDGTVTWSLGGRITASFAAHTDASTQPHLSDVGSATTPQPTAVGGYSGVSTNPQGLLE